MSVAASCHCRRHDTFVEASDSSHMDFMQLNYSVIKPRSRFILNKLLLPLIQIWISDWWNLLQYEKYLSKSADMGYILHFITHCVTVKPGPYEK
jgi:hypothetical protein